MGDFSIIFLLLFKEKIMLQSHFIKSNHRVLKKNEPPVFAPDYSITGIAAKM